MQREGLRKEDIIHTSPIEPEYIEDDDDFFDNRVKLRSAPKQISHPHKEEIITPEEIIEETFSLEERERETILKALKKNNGKRKQTAIDLGISERTLYRKIKDYNIE